MSIAERLATIAENEPKVYEAGKQAQYDEFWDTYQASAPGGQNLFSGVGWNAKTFYPKHDIPINFAGVFHYFSWYSNNYGIPALDLAERLDECGVKLDDSNGMGANMFTHAWVKRVPKLKASASGSLTQLFRGAKVLVTVDGLELPEDNTFSFSQTFSDCEALANITIIGTVARSVSFANSSKLTSASVDSIISALKQLEEGDGAQTLTLHATVKVNMSEAQIAAIAEKGWTLA